MEFSLNNQEIIEKKQALRKQMKFLRESIPAEDFSRHMENALNAFTNYIKRNGKPDTLLCYVSSKNEAPTKNILFYAFMEKIPVYVPKVLKKRTMVFVKIHSLSDCETGTYGILEPKITDTSEIIGLKEYRNLLPKTCIFTAYEDLTNAFMIVPGLSFDHNKGRLGFGGGYYDTYLSKTSVRTKSIALLYDFQLVEQVPMEPHDAYVNDLMILSTL